MKKGGPARPGHDPTMETAMGVVACVIVGLLFVTARPVVNARDGVPYSGAAVLQSRFPPPADRLHRTGGSRTEVKKPATSSVEALPPAGAATTDTPTAAGPSGTPDLARLAHKDLYQVVVPEALAQTDGDAEPVKVLVEAAVHVATAANVLIGTHYTRQIREAHEIMAAELDRVSGLQFANPKWKGACKKATASIRHIKGAADMIFKVRESDDYDDTQAEELENQGRRQLKIGMVKLQRVVNYMEILRQKGFMTKA